MHQANLKRENNVKDLTHQMSVSGTATGKTRPVQKLTAMQTGTIATGIQLKVTHAVIGRTLTDSCTAESMLTTNGKIGATIETLLEPSMSVTGTTMDALLWAKMNHGIIVSGTRIAPSQNLKTNSLRMMEPGKHIFCARKLLENKPIPRHNNRHAHSMTMSLMITGDVTGQIVAVILSLAIQTGTHATGTGNAPTKTPNSMILMGILNVSKTIRSKIATRMTPMAYIMIVIGSTLTVNNWAKRKAGTIASGTAFVTAMMNNPLQQASSTGYSATRTMKAIVMIQRNTILGMAAI